MNFGSMVWSPKGWCARFVLREDHGPKTPQVWSPKGWCAGLAKGTEDLRSRTKVQGGTWPSAIRQDNGTMTHVQRALEGQAQGTSHSAMRDNGRGFFITRRVFNK